MLAQLSRDFVRVVSLSFWRGANLISLRPYHDFARVGWRGANFDIAPATLPSGHFVRVGSLWLWRGADFSKFSEILAKRSYEFCGRSFYNDLA